MSAIKIIGDNEGRRDPVSSDRTTVYTDGYKLLITASTPYSIANVLAASGVINLTNAYVPGTHNLTVKVNGQDLVQPGQDYIELNNTQIQLSTAAGSWVDIITSDPTNATIYIEWNRPLPGARDQELNNLRDVTPDLSDAIKDVGALRSTANAGNPLATIADIGGGVSPMEGKTIVPVPKEQTHIGSVLSEAFNSDIAVPTGNGSAYNDYYRFGSVNLATDGAARSIPSGATHAVIRVLLDANITVGGTASANGAVVSYVGEYDSGVGIGSNPGVLVDPNGFIDVNRVAAWTNGTQATEANMSDAHTVIVPIAGSSPHISWGFFQDPDPSNGLVTSSRLMMLWVDAFIIDEVGRAADPVSFSAIVGPIQSIPAPGGAGNDILLNFNTIRFNTGSGFSLASHVFTAPISGKYFFSGQFNGTPTPTAIAIEALLCKNGNPSTAVEVILGHSVSSASTGSNEAIVAGLIELAAGDTVGLYARCSNGIVSNLPVLSAAFQGHLVTADNTGLVFNGMLAEKTTSQSTSGGSAFITNYTSEEVDTYGAFDPVSGIFTAPLDGIYEMTGTVYWNAATSGSAQQRHLILTTSAGSITHSMVPATSETDPTQQITYRKQLTAGHTVRLQILSPGADEPISYARLEIQKIG